MESDAFGDAEFVGAAPTETLAPAAGVLLDDDAFGSAPAEAPAEANGSNGTPLGGQESMEDAFFSHYTPQHTADVPPTPPPAPAADARAALRKANEQTLKKKEAEEAQAKQAVLSKAKEFLKKSEEARTTLLTQRKQNNRKKESVVKAAETPSGANTWEKVHSMINFSSTTGHAKDLSRFKNVLIGCKSNNVAVRA